MKLGSTPDESADYWEERADIDKWIAVLEQADANIKRIATIYDDKEKKFKQLFADYKKSSDIPSLQNVLSELKTEQEATMNLLEETYDNQDVVVGTQKEMSDCQIPVNIRMRANEIDQLRERLDHINDEFNELKSADDAFEGSSDSETEIKALIEKIDRKLKSFDTEK